MHQSKRSVFKLLIIRKRHTIRPKLTSAIQCFDVPGSWPGDGVQLIVYTCFESDNQRWQIS